MSLMAFVYDTNSLLWVKPLVIGHRVSNYPLSENKEDAVKDEINILVNAYIL